jgi:hypothetical protein
MLELQVEAQSRAQVETAAASEKEVSSLRLQVQELKALLESYHPSISASGIAGAGDLVELPTEVDGAASVTLPEPVVVEKVIYVEKPVERVVEKIIEKIVTVERLVYVEKAGEKIEAKHVDPEGEAQLGAQHSENSSGKAGTGDFAELIERVQANVVGFFNLREKSYVEELFKKHANDATNLMTADAMTAALRELGKNLIQDEAAAVFESADADENRGLDLQEFIKAINHPSKVQQWVETLPLSSLLAHCLSFKGGDSSDPLREVSRLSIHEIRASIQAYCESAEKIVADAVHELKKCHDAMDALAASSAGNTKFQTPKMSAGSVEEFYQGLLGRVGECFYSYALSIAVQSPSFLQAPRTRTFPRAWRTSIAPRPAAPSISTRATTACGRTRARSTRSRRGGARALPRTC